MLPLDTRVVKLNEEKTVYIMNDGNNFWEVWEEVVFRQEDNSSFTMYIYDEDIKAWVEVVFLGDSHLYSKALDKQYGVFFMDYAEQVKSQLALLVIKDNGKYWREVVKPLQRYADSLSFHE